VDAAEPDLGAVRRARRHVGRQVVVERARRPADPAGVAAGERGLADAGPPRGVAALVGHAVAVVVDAIAADLHGGRRRAEEAEQARAEKPAGGPHRPLRAARAAPRAFSRTTAASSRWTRRQPATSRPRSMTARSSAFSVS